MKILDITTAKQLDWFSFRFIQYTFELLSINIMMIRIGRSSEVYCIIGVNLVSNNVGYDDKGPIILKASE